LAGEGKVTKNLRDGQLVIQDNAAVNTITLALEEGNLSFTVTKNVIEVLDRGVLSHMRQGDEVPVTLSFGIKFIEFYTSGDDETLYEAVMNEAGGAAWISTNDDGGDVYTVDMLFTIATPTSGEEAEIITFTKVRGNFTFNEGDEYNTLAFDGTAFQTAPTIAKES